MRTLIDFHDFHPLKDNDSLHVERLAANVAPETTWTVCLAWFPTWR
jgi:hypothetical protein